MEGKVVVLFSNVEKESHYQPHESTKNEYLVGIAEIVVGRIDQITVELASYRAN